MSKSKPWNWGIIFGGDNLSMADLLRYAEMADAAGADSVWSVELWRDAFVPLTAMASVVRRARLGTGIAQLARPPWHTEMSAMSLAEVTGGRFVLGVGTGPPTWNADWHGLELTKPVFAAKDAAAEETRDVLAYTLEASLRLLHPLVAQVVEVPRAVPDVDLRIAEIRDDEASATRP